MAFLFIGEGEGDFAGDGGADLLSEREADGEFFGVALGLEGGGGEDGGDASGDEGAGAVSVALLAELVGAEGVWLHDDGLSGELFSGVGGEPDGDLVGRHELIVDGEI